MAAALSTGPADPPPLSWEQKAKEFCSHSGLVLPNPECFAIAGVKMADWLQRRDTRDHSKRFYPQGGLIADTYTAEFVKLNALLLRTCTCAKHTEMRTMCADPQCQKKPAVCPTKLTSCEHVFCMCCILNKRANAGCLAQTSCPRCSTHFYAYNITRCDGKRIDFCKWQEEPYTEADI